MAMAFLCRCSTVANKDLDIALDRDAEDLKWLQFFNDPTQWWDNRAKHWKRKNYPHFKHAKTGESLWTSSVNCPKWVHPKLKSLKLARASSRAARAEYKEIQFEDAGITTTLSSLRDSAADLRKSPAPEKPSISTLLSALKECSRSKDLRKGMKLHSVAIASRLSSNKFVITSLINMYAKCGRMSEAVDIFDRILHHDVVSWTALIKGYVQNGEHELALEIFDGMKDGQGFCTPDARTFVAALSACAALAAEDEAENSKWLEKGKEIHSQAISSRCCNIFVENAMVDLYGKCVWQNASG